MTRLLLLAPPGAGKSTQGRLLAEDYGVPHISTGELLRGEVARGTPLGRRVQEHVQRGLLVPDEIVLDLVRRRLTEPAPVRGFVLDGFPRTLGQALAAYAWASEHGLTFTAVVRLEVTEEELARRIAARAAEGRADDDESTWRRRLAGYRLETEPLLDFYRERGILLEVDATGDVATVHRRIAAALDGAG